ncbi:KH domain-containing protein [Ruminococcaceae bacterium OttesenSCG-928-D13]|nr:KH domain-containing protein [Ruminococcaceae bacterium OttesenSCG-928-D13]
MEEVLIAMAKGLVNDKDAVSVTVEEPSETEIIFHLNVAEDDKGRVIGQKGSKARAIRTIISAIAAKEGKRSRVEID